MLATQDWHLYKSHPLPRPLPTVSTSAATDMRLPPLLLQLHSLLALLPLLALLLAALLQLRLLS